MNPILFFGILLTLSLLSLYFGKRSADHLKNQEGYFLRGRTVQYTALTITIVATQLGGGSLIGISNEAYHKGWIALLYPLGIYFGLILLALGVGARLRKHEVTTLPELFQKVYHSPILRKIAGLFSAFSMWVILVAQGTASRQFFISLGYEDIRLFLMFWSVVIAYTVMGGFGAVVSTDIVQTVFMITSLVILSVSVLYALPSTDLLFHSGNHFANSGDYINWLIMPMLFMVIGQDMGQRCSAANTPQTVSKATATAALLYLLLSLVPASLGVIAHQLNLPMVEGESILFSAILHLTNPTITTLAACAILMATISTANSLLSALSSNLAMDIWPKHSLQTSRWLTLGGGVSAIVISLSFHNIVSLLIMSYEASIYLLFAPIFFSICLKHPPRWLAAWSVAWGILCFVAKYAMWVDPQWALIGFFGGNVVLWMLYKIKSS